MLLFLRCSSSVHKLPSVVQGAAFQVKEVTTKTATMTPNRFRLQDYTIYGSKIKINIDIKT